MPEEVLLQLRIYVQDVITFLKMLSICLGDATKLRSFGITFPMDTETSNFDWISPSLNSNMEIGCWYEANGKGGFGGVFRDQNGDWILDFYGKLICTSSLETEI